MQRRSFLYLTLLASAISTRLVHAQEWEEVLRKAIQSDPDNSVFLGAEPLPANDPRWSEAEALLNSMPTKGSPYQVAKMLNSAVPQTFRKEWPTRFANPLIVDFFVATNTKPEGDVTAWCAAFMSWCVERVGMESTRSAASKSYRNFGAAVWERGQTDFPGRAVEGDIAVFKNLAKPDNGHVAFYVQPDPKAMRRILVLGGNQSDQIGISSYRMDGNLRLESIRRIS